MLNSTLKKIMMLSAVVSLGILSADVGNTAPGGKDRDSQTGTATHNWDRAISGAARFTILADFNNQAARDNNTGLVWELVADSTPRTWSESAAYCINKTVGGATGWRLPSVVELSSVRDPAIQTGFIPAIFSGVQNTIFWSATTYAAIPTQAWTVSFSSWETLTYVKGTSSWAWCVRGPMNADAY